MTQSHIKLPTSKEHKSQQHEEPRSESGMLNDSKSSPTQSTGGMEKLDTPSTYTRKIRPPLTGHKPQKLTHNYLTNRLTQYHRTSIRTDIWTPTSTQTCNEINVRDAHQTGITPRMDGETQKKKSKKRERWG